MKEITIELDESKEIIEIDRQVVIYCEILIEEICNSSIKIFPHDRAIRQVAKRFNLDLNKAEKIYNMTRYYELQP